MASIDLKKDRPDLYRPGTKEFVEVVVPPTTYLCVDGHGDPHTEPRYAAAVEALFTCGYAVRAAFRERTGDVFVVGPLGGLWTSADPRTFVSRTKAEWDWTMLVPLPGEVDHVDVEAGLTTAARKKPELPIADVEVRTVDEGRCLQILHAGSYDDEGPVLARLHDEVMPAAGLTWNGPHHEIYLSDPRKVEPSRLRTVLRQPVRSLPDATATGR